MSSFSAPSFYLSPSKAALQLQYVGKNLREIPTPAAVLDLAPIRRNCKAMLEATKALGLGFRAHVKTHKVCHGVRSILSQKTNVCKRLPSSLNTKWATTPKT